MHGFPKREDAQEIRARNKARAIRIGEELEGIRPHFGFTFGCIAPVLLGFSALHLYSRLVRNGGPTHMSSHETWRTIIVCCVLLGAGLVFALAWWTTRRVKPPKRAWAIAASVLSLASPFYVVLFANKPMRASEWEIMAYGALALFIYGWPDPPAVGRRTR